MGKKFYQLNKKTRQHQWDYAILQRKQQDRPSAQGVNKTSSLVLKFSGGVKITCILQELSDWL